MDSLHQAKQRRERTQMVDDERIRRGDSCEECGISNVTIAGKHLLEWHHVGEKVFKIAAAITFSKLAIRRELKKCRLLCPNCHKLAEMAK